MLDIDEAVRITRTGDLWLFRGRTAADRAIRAVTNAPVNHVGMAIVVDDLPPLMWHAELSKALLDVWSGSHHRGVQLHDLGDAVRRWRDTYGQASWMRQLAPEVGRAEEDAALRAVARLDGVSFPSTTRLATRWLRGRGAYLPRRRRSRRVRPEAAFCAETVALTLQEMGVVADDRKAHWFDPGTFWSGAHLPLQPGWSYGEEIQVGPPPDPSRAVPDSRTRWRL
ncbi:hypothetical protein [Nocardioides sp. TF02-7]|uniref:hypothetical protein n=1 Tax=Nocardioides sp. TF02-7 TaxID=2917724 RepID=UPI001F0649E6|nr:hypothetical protein [Nocardioides sp. TF02-7]UMG93616.1 hypothetical protein MF408_05340 [Nocardioides sp. TF02-7]